MVLHPDVRQDHAGTVACRKTHGTQEGPSSTNAGASNLKYSRRDRGCIYCMRIQR